MSDRTAIFLTGFPGFLGSELLHPLLRASPEHDAVCLVQPKFRDLAAARVRHLEGAHPELTGRIRLVPGDITLPDLGLGDAGPLRERIREVYHLAAVYDLSVEAELADRVNVAGTRHVVRFARRCQGLERLHYVSTCYVSGRYRGFFTESHLEEGQAFHNQYELSKHRAEVEVRRAIEEGLPGTIYRPSIVVGDSRTGTTQKYDGPYYIIRWLLRQPRLAVLPVTGRPAEHRVNLVPRDFVVDSMLALGRRADTVGRTLHLADPAPPTVDEMVEMLAGATGRRIVRVPLPITVAKGAIDRVPGVYRLMKIPSAAVDYFAHPAEYGMEETAPLLAEEGIRCPPVRSYLDRLVEFTRAHPEVEARAMA
jgi:thioester reductase-like protein